VFARSTAICSSTGPITGPILRRMSEPLAVLRHVRHG
jgi:hypothetical protein